MYVIFRQIHFYSGAFLLVFLLLFFITGYLLTQHDWFDHPDPVIEKSSYQLSVPKIDSEQQKADWIRKEYNLKGKSSPVRQKDNGSWQVDFISPRFTIKTHVFPDADSVAIEKSANPTYRTIVVFHRMHNYGGGLRYDIYLAFMDMVSISLLVFSITGMYLWWKLIRAKWLGAGLLATGFAYVIWVVMTFIN